MKNTTKRLTALLLALVLCLSLLSAQVWAAEEPEDGSVSAQSSEVEEAAPEVEEAAPEAEESEPEAEESESEPEETEQEAEESDVEPEEELTAQGIVASGNCGKNGNNVTWTLDDEGTLTFSGTGEMDDYLNESEPPWITYYTQIQTVVVNYGISNIGIEAFSGCSNLTLVTLPESVISIGQLAFYSCTRLPSITLPSSVYNMGHEVFGACFSLETVALPESITQIPMYSFERCSSLRSIEIPSRVNTISHDAFFDCTSLESVTLPASLRKVQEKAFYNCTSLKQVNIPKGVNSIGEKAFGCYEESGIVKKRSGFQISGYWGTAAEDYATDNGFAFTPLGAVNCSHTWGVGYYTRLPTCASPGTVRFKCTKCGEEQVLTLPIMAGAHSWDGGVVTKKPTYAAAGEKTFTCTLCHATRTEAIDKLEQSEPQSKSDNTITASDVVKSYSPKAQSFSLNTAALGGAALSCQTGNARVQVDGVHVTLPAKFSGTVNITITSSETAQYKPATKTITVTVPTVTKLKKATGGKGQIALEWKKNKTGKKYEIQVALKKDFKKTAKKVTVKKNTTLKTTVKGLKKGTYFVRIRTVNGKAVSDWSGAKKVTVK